MTNDRPPQRHKPDVTIEDCTIRDAENLIVSKRKVDRLEIHGNDMSEMTILHGPGVHELNMCGNRMRSNSDTEANRRGPSKQRKYFGGYSFSKGDHLDEE